MTRSGDEPNTGWTPDPATAAAAAATTGPQGLGGLAPDAAFRDALALALAPAFAVERELEGGGMARVFVAREVALDRLVVVKVLPPDLAAGVNRERFRREIQLAAQLQHPLIVPLLAAGEVGAAGGDAAGSAAAGSLYYTMPFIEGESLRAEVAARAARGAAFAPREVLRILRDVVSALGHAHARGVVHRDVKPGNVLLQSGHALVTDFGVAKALATAIAAAQPGRGLTVTTLGTAVGTPAYMAPEQLAADPAADHRMDLYAAALVAYELLAGASPFAAASPQATLAAQLTRVPEPLGTLRSDVPPALAAVVMRCLAKDPAARPASAAELLDELDGAEAGLRSGASGGVVPGAPATAPTAAVPAAEATRPIAAPRRPAARGWRAQALVAGAVLAATVGGAAMWLSRDGGSRPGAPPAAAATVAAAPVTAPSVTAPPVTAPPAAASPALSRADSIAIAAAVTREFERAAARAAARRPAAVATAPAESARLHRGARDRVADSLMRGEDWGKFSRDIVRATVARLPMDPRHMPPEARREVEAAMRESRKYVFVAPPAPTPPGVPGVPEGGPKGPWPGFMAVTSTVTPTPPGVRRVALVAASDETNRPDLARIARAFDLALRARLRAGGAYEVTDYGVAVLASREHVPDPVVADRTGAGAAVRPTLRAEGDRLQATARVFDARRSMPVTVRADVALPAPGSVSAPELAGALAEALGAAVIGALGKVGW